MGEFKCDAIYSLQSARKVCMCASESMPHNAIYGYNGHGEKECRGTTPCASGQDRVPASMPYMIQGCNAKFSEVSQTVAKQSVAK